MTYLPDNWVVLKITGSKRTHYRVLGGWSGSYLTGDSWRLNSGIVKVTEDENYYNFFGSSGSCYQCHKDCYGLRANNAHAYNIFKDRYGDLLELIPEDTDFLNLATESRDVKS